MTRAQQAQTETIPAAVAASIAAHSDTEAVVEPGRRVTVAALAAQSAGATLVPINTRWKGEGAAYVLSASRAAMLVTTVGFLGGDPVRMLRSAGTPLPHLRRIVLLEGAASSADLPGDGEVEPWHVFSTRGAGSPGCGRAIAI